MRWAGWRLRETPFAIVDVETTGFGAERHRIVEIAILHQTGLREANVVLETLIKPDRRVGNREIHGINNRVVRQAPPFADVAKSICQALRDRILVAHNASFDMSFLGKELRSISVPWPVPWICTMQLQRSLHDTAAALRAVVAVDDTTVSPRPNHRAVDDARAAALLFAKQILTMEARGIETIDDLAGIGSGVFTNPDADMLHFEDINFLPASSTPLPRELVVRSTVSTSAAEPQYIELLERLLLHRTSVSIAELSESSQQISSADRARQHALVMGRLLIAEANDAPLDARSMKRIRDAMEHLSRLGWKPGDTL